MRKSKHLFITLIGLIIIVILSATLLFRDRTTLLDIAEFERIIQDDIQSHTIKHAYTDKNYLYIRTEHGRFKISKDLIDLKSLTNFPIEVSNSTSFEQVLSNIGIIIIILLGGAVLINALYRALRKDKIPLSSPQMTNSQRNEILQLDDLRYNALPINSNINFSQIAGIKEVKNDLLEIIDYLKNPQKYEELGIQLPKGVLLVGPPGVGKTMIAKAIANEANVPFFYQSGSSFVQIYVGVGAKRVRELFSRARASSPSIIFIDEIDAVGKARGNHRNDEREATLNQLLTEMDGFEDRKGVIVIGATNKIEVLDSALLRAGRFDRRIFIGLPDFEERVQILEMYLQNKEHSIEVNEIARQCVGFSSASIASLVNEASLNALRRNSKVIENEDFIASKDKVVDGLRKQLSFSDEEKEILALYQAAKAISAYWCDIEFDKISLIGERMKEVDKNIFSKTDLINKIKVALSGNVVLELIRGETYTNCKDDIALAREIATEMSEQYAMSGKMLADMNDILEILENTKDELKVFFNNAKNALNEVQLRLLEKEKITKEELGEILKKELFV